MFTAILKQPGILRWTQRTSRCVGICSKRNISVDHSVQPNEQEYKVKVSNVEVSYVKRGEGPHVLLLLPGALGSAWTDFTPQLNSLDTKLFTMIAWDPPGYGKSVPPYRDFPIDFLERDADTALLFMRNLNFKKFSMLGWSDGGITSMFVASKYPEYVHKMVIWGVNSYILNTEMAAYESIRDVRKWSKRMREPLEKLYGEQYLREMWNSWCDAMKRICEERRGDICKSHLANIKCPSFIVYGGRDTLVHPEHLSILRSNITNSVCHTYPEGGHNLHLKFPQDFNQRVTDFLTK